MHIAAATVITVATATATATIATATAITSLRGTMSRRRLRLSRWLRLRLRPPSLRLRLSRRSAALCPWRRLRLSRWLRYGYGHHPSVTAITSLRGIMSMAAATATTIPSRIRLRAAVAAPHCWINSYANEPPNATAGSTSATRSAGGGSSQQRQAFPPAAGACAREGGAITSRQLPRMRQRSDRACRKAEGSTIIPLLRFVLGGFLGCFHRGE